MGLRRLHLVSDNVKQKPPEFSSDGFIDWDNPGISLRVSVEFYISDRIRRQPQSRLAVNEFHRYFSVSKMLVCDMAYGLLDIHIPDIQLDNLVPYYILVICEICDKDADRPIFPCRLAGRYL